MCLTVPNIRIKINRGPVIPASCGTGFASVILDRVYNNDDYCTFNSLTISFLIGRKRTVNFRNQRLGRHLAADYTIIVSRTLKVTSNHVMYDRGAWSLRVIRSSSRALCCLPSVKKQILDFQVCFVDRARRRKSSWRQGLPTYKKGRRRWQRSCLLITWTRKKLREPEVFLHVSK